VAIQIGRTELKVHRAGDEYQLRPSVFERVQQFSFPALRYPPSSLGRAAASRRAASNGMKDSAVFYINL
jgi:hypothetical protein